MEYQDREVSIDGSDPVRLPIFLMMNAAGLTDPEILRVECLRLDEETVLGNSTVKRVK